MCTHVRKGLVLVGLFILCLYLANLFSEYSEPTDLELSSVWGGIDCYKCVTYTTDCNSPPNDCAWNSEFKTCFGQECSGGDNACEMSNAGHCEEGTRRDSCTPKIRECLRIGTSVADCTQVGPAQCDDDGWWEYYSCHNGTYNGCE